MGTGPDRNACQTPLVAAREPQKHPAKLSQRLVNTPMKGKVACVQIILENVWHFDFLQRLSEKFLGNSFGK